MSKLNRIQIMGRIIEEPEVTYLPGSGVPAIKLRVMTDDGWWDTKKSEYVKRNSYHTVKQINKDADKHGLRKDDWAFVEGSKLTDSWEDRDGNKKYADYIRATIIVEIPNPWDKKGDKGSDSGRGDTGCSGGNDRSYGDNDDSRGRGSGRSNADNQKDDRGYNDRGDVAPNDDIPF